MFEGIIDSLAASIIGTTIKHIWNNDKLSKIIFHIINPTIYSKYTCLKRYPAFEYDFIEIKKSLFNNKNIKNGQLLKKINYKTHGKNYLDFIIIDSSATYHMEITNNINSFNKYDNMTPDLILKIRSISPITAEYRKCNNIIDLKVINNIYDIIEKKYKIIENFSSFELVSSKDKKVKYPKNAFKETDGIHEIIYNNTISIKSYMPDDIINCLNKHKFKLFKK